MRALSKLELLRPPTTEDQVDAMREHVRTGAADRPGVYRMLAAGGEVVYVGKSKRLRSRLMSYFRCGPSDKGHRILREAERIEWEYTPSEFAALLAELKHIKSHRPRFNVQMKRDDRNYCFIKITRGPAPKMVVVRGPGHDEASAYYGPFQGAVRVSEALRELNDVLGLRDCSLDQKMHFSDQEDLFGEFARTPGCIRFEVKKCLGPCVGACTVGQYDERMHMAREFLDGEDNTPIEFLKSEMELASTQLQYERAGAFRDKVKRLEELRKQFNRLTFAVEALSFVYNVPGHEGDDRVYLIRRGRVRAEVAAPKTPDDAAGLLELIDSVYTPIERDTTRIPTNEIDELLLLSSWFKRFPEELTHTSSGRQLMLVS
ncbi:MAG: UvrB/UvrC motif-containing protein [Gemmatimonadaceae bacterium]